MKGANLKNSRNLASRVTAAAGLVVCMLVAVAALGGVGAAQSAVSSAQGAYGKKVTICHKGKTISVSKKAWPAHQRHGDTLGPCTSAAAKKAKAAKLKAAKAKAKAAKAKAAKAKAEQAKAEQAKAEQAKAEKKEDKSERGDNPGKGKGKGQGLAGPRPHAAVWTIRGAGFPAPRVLRRGTSYRVPENSARRSIRNPFPSVAGAATPAVRKSTESTVRVGLPSQ